MSKQAEGELILKLYDLRRETTMRQARDWFAMGFNPKTGADVRKVMFSEDGAKLRMVTSYWEMAAALVVHGAISPELFQDTNGEHVMVFAKLEPVLDEVRGMMGPGFLASLEKVIDGMPNGRERCSLTRQRIESIIAEVAASRQKQEELVSTR